MKEGEDKNRPYQSPNIHKTSYIASKSPAEGYYPATPDNKSRMMQTSSPPGKAIPPLTTSKEYPHSMNMQSSFTLPNGYNQQIHRSSKNFNEGHPQTEEKRNFKMLSSERMVDETRITFDKLKVKVVRESENVVDKDDGSMLKFSKSASQRHMIPKTTETKQTAQNEILVIKSGKKLSQEEDDSQEIKILKEQIKQAERLNEKIKGENLQLRLQKVKLSSDSNTMQILSLKREIKEIRKKIEELNEEKKQYSTERTNRPSYHEEQRKKYGQYKGNGIGGDFGGKGTKGEEHDFQKSAGSNGWGGKKNDFTGSFGTKNNNTPINQNSNYKTKHTNHSNVTPKITQIGLSQIKSIQKLASSNDLNTFSPGTPTSTPTISFPSHHNNLFNSQIPTSPKAAQGSFPYNPQKLTQKKNSKR